MVNRIKNRLIAGTATDIPLQHIFQLFIRRLRHFSQQRRGTHQYARSTKTALHAAFLDKCLLQFLRQRVIVQSFKRGDFRLIALPGQTQS